MKIFSIADSPFHTLAYRNVTSRHGVVTVYLPVLRATVDHLPGDLQAIVATADLQGRGLDREDGGPAPLLGELLAEELESLAVRGEIPSPDVTGVILAGDLYTPPGLDRRGGSGDVRAVWDAFARSFCWVVGVAGNHDFFGPRDWSVPDVEAFKKQKGGRFLDGNSVTLDSLRIGGVSGTIGNPNKPHRKLEEDFCDSVERLAAAGLDILAMHDGPDATIMNDGPDAVGIELLGRPSVRAVLERSKPTLVIRGHAYWRTPLATLSNGTQVLNVDSRVVILQSAKI
jgi:hypothetical protein